MAEKFFPMYVRAPSSEEEILDSRSEYDTAGMTGCIGSADATHVQINKMQAGLKQYHKGVKLHTPARAFNMVVNHRLIKMFFLLNFVINLVLIYFTLKGVESLLRQPACRQDGTIRP
jgi:hypothetical protein